MTQPGDQLAGYRIERRLGSGGMGEVFLARHVVLGRTAAIKVLRSSSEPEQERETVRFIDEARAAAGIDHPAIVQVLDCGILPDQQAYIVMEYLCGMSVREALFLEPPLRNDPAFVAALLGEAAEGLAAAHARGIVHRDVKPENLFLQHDPRSAGMLCVKVLDFGIAKLQRLAEVGTLTKSGALLGTPLYMAPEQCRGERTLDGRTDIYALGCVAFELLTGRTVFDSESVGAMLILQATEPAPPLGEITTGLPAPLVTLVDRMLAKKPADRPQSMNEVVDALAQLLDCAPRDFSRWLKAPPTFAPPPRERCGPLALPPAAALLAKAPGARVAGSSSTSDKQPPALEPPPAHPLAITPWLPREPNALGQMDTWKSDPTPGADPEQGAGAPRSPRGPDRNADGRIDTPLVAPGEIRHYAVRHGRGKAVLQASLAGLVVAGLGLAIGLQAPQLTTTDHPAEPTTRSQPHVPRPMAQPSAPLAQRTERSTDLAGPLSVQPQESDLPTGIVAQAEWGPTASGRPPAPRTDRGRETQRTTTNRPATGQTTVTQANRVSIKVSSTPAGAEVWLAGGSRPQGTTPLTLTLPRKSGPVPLTLRLANHVTRTVEVSPAHPLAVQIKLESAQDPNQTPPPSANMAMRYRKVEPPTQAQTPGPGEAQSAHVANASPSGLSSPAAPSTKSGPYRRVQVRD